MIKRTIFANGRVSFAAIFMTILVMAMIVQLFLIQIVDHQKYKVMAQKEQIKSLILPAERGLIYASDGDRISPLVMNQTIYDLFADPQVIDDKDNLKISKFLASQIKPKLLKSYRKSLNKKDSRYQILAKGLTREEAEKIKKKGFYGLGFTAYNRRVYPEGRLASQILGFVNAEGKGQYGIEQQLNDRLTGKDGYLKTVTDVSNVPLTIGPELINIDPKHGDNLVLSIDRNIQYKAGQILARKMNQTGAKQGSILVMNPNNGQVMAMVNLPDFDPAEYYKVKDINAFNNSAVDMPYEAGSVIKTFTVAMGLDRKIITPTAVYYNNDCVMVYDRRICNLTKGLAGSRTFQFALTNSLNTGMIEIVKKLGSGSISKPARNIMYDYFNNKYRFSRPTGIELPEVSARIISPNEAEGNAVRYSNMSFGQGFNVTMIQAAAAFSSIINGGTYYQPTIIKGTIKQGQIAQKPAKIINKQVISAKASAEIKQMAHLARSSYYAGSDKKGYLIGGKTGTSETLVNGKYNAQRTIASYLGYGGTTKQPKYVIMIRLADSKKKTLSGSFDAGPAFTELSNWLIDYLKLQPKE